jgi:hypothetical protein
MQDFEREVEEKILRKLTPEQRLEGLSPEQLLARLSPEQRLAGLSCEEIEKYLEKQKASERKAPSEHPETQP